MQFIIHAWTTLSAQAGPLWQYAVIAAFVSMILDSAKPKRQEGEEKESEGGRNILMLVSLLTPFLLFAHACWKAYEARDVGLMNAVVVVGLVVIVSGVIGWIIAAAVPALGRVLYRIAPWVALAVFAFTLYVTWEGAWSAFNHWVLSRSA
ncbi:hypothetical protein [Terricaulis sp.]|uniref:hypothetical protein n=1 Tax=Terricaulis sp. TaxID=2768686 RepID=UPI0037833906